MQGRYGPGMLYWLVDFPDMDMTLIVGQYIYPRAIFCDFLEMPYSGVYNDTRFGQSYVIICGQTLEPMLSPVHGASPRGRP